MKNWFATRRLEPGIFLVSEPVHVNSFLIEGSSAAALIDTGLGIGNIRQVAEELASHDVFALNTHYHFDHSGGNHWFSARLIHEDGAPIIERPVGADLYRRYGEFIGQLVDALPRFRDLDEDVIQCDPREVRRPEPVARGAVRPQPERGVLESFDGVEEFADG